MLGDEFADTEAMPMKTNCSRLSRATHEKPGRTYVEADAAAVDLPGEEFHAHARKWLDVAYPGALMETVRADIRQRVDSGVSRLRSQSLEAL